MSNLRAFLHACGRMSKALTYYKPKPETKSVFEKMCEEFYDMAKENDIVSFQKYCKQIIEFEARQKMKQEKKMKVSKKIYDK